MKTPNLFADIPAELPEELCEALVEGGGVRIERIVSRGHASPEGFWHDSNTQEWVALLRGRAGLRIEGERELVELGPGDWVAIPAHARHRVEWTLPNEDTVWLAVHYG
ncbi:MAG: cupin domain-containing protein [Planctomycetota bacterium]